MLCTAPWVPNKERAVTSLLGMLSPALPWPLSSLAGAEFAKLPLQGLALTVPQCLQAPSLTVFSQLLRGTSLDPYPHSPSACLIFIQRLCLLHRTSAPHGSNLALSTSVPQHLEQCLAQSRHWAAPDDVISKTGLIATLQGLLGWDRIDYDRKAGHDCWPQSGWASATTPPSWRQIGLWHGEPAWRSTESAGGWG